MKSSLSIFSKQLNRSVSSGRVSKAWLSSAPPRQLNVAFGLKKEDETHAFHELAQQPVTALQGIGPKHEALLESLNIKTIEQLSKYKFFHLARSIKTLSTIEEAGGRLEGSTMNLDKGLDKDYEHMHFAELLDAPVDALSGISEEKGKLWNSLGVKTVGDLADYKFCKWSEAITTAVKYEKK